MLRDSTAAMRTLSAVTTFAVVVAVSLTGCGIKGPLTLPRAPASGAAGAPAAPADPPTPAASSEAAPATPPPLPATKP